MVNTSIYKDIAKRTGGDIYIGVVGPVRTGKSTFIKRFMDMLVLPVITDEAERSRVIDELPQSGAGRTVMTTQPTFVPNRAVDIVLGDNVKMSVRMADCVGYLVEGAQGHTEGGEKRMVNTPWLTEAVPFEQAAEMGTRKVICDHSTIGIVMTTDGSIADIPREAYIPAEERTVAELKQLDKPFCVLLNCVDPESEAALTLAEELSAKYEAPVLPINATNFDERELTDILSDILYEFPVKEVRLTMPEWITALDGEHYIIAELKNSLTEAAGKIQSMRDYAALPDMLEGLEFFAAAHINDLNMGEGRMAAELVPAENLFYRVLSEETGCEITDDKHLISTIKQMSASHRSYNRIASAVSAVKERGYGIVAPLLEEVTPDMPQVFCQGERYGVKFTACAPTLHMMQVDVSTEVSTIIGSEEQSQQFARALCESFEAEDGTAWNTEIFGRTLGDMVNEGLQLKAAALSEQTLERLRTTMERAVNEGDGGVLFVLL